MIDPVEFRLKPEDRAVPDLQAAMIQHLETLDGLVKDANYLAELLARSGTNPIAIFDRLWSTAVALAKQAGDAQQTGEELSQAHRDHGLYRATYGGGA